MEDMQITADEIRDGRERMRMTQQQLADAVGVSKRTIGSWERGETIPRNRLLVVAEVLHLDQPSQREFGRGALQLRIGALAKQRREEIGLGRVAFARAVGIGSDKTVQDFEFGRRLPHGATVRKIEKALGWKIGVVDELLEGPDRKATDLQLEDLDEFEPNQPMPIDRIPTADLLAEVQRRLSAIQNALGSPNPSIQEVLGMPAPSKDLYGLAASTNVEHLEDEENEDVNND